ncbi:MAG: pyridoxal phosphate-dependent aminotransferase [Acidobacteriota bacterium]|nr:MAG: pyridoxal phosphate-dependent aminotransferase [Acidobacteriota bacterium]
MEVLERAFELEAQGRSVIHLEVGEPDFDTPEVVREAGVQAIRDGHTHYTHSLGMIGLREAICEWQLAQYGVRVDPGQVVVTSGSSAAMLLVFAALLDPGNRVLLTDPGYPCYAKFVQAFEGEPVQIAVREEDAFQFPLGRLREELTDQTRAVVVNSPSNPTGTVSGPDYLERVCRVSDSQALVVSDEIYHGLVYEGEAHSILEYTDHAVVINGFSKLFAMTGWRLGYAILPKHLVRPVQKLQQNLLISAPDFAQHAAIVALRQAGDDVRRMRDEYDRRRKVVLNALAEIGLKIAVEPTGAFYVFVNVSRYTENVYDFSFELLEKAGVAVTPGVDFGSNGEGYVRICYANSMEKIEEGMTRLKTFFSKLD